MLVDLNWGAWAPYALITASAIAAGFVNAFAGGGTFFSYPAFVAAGVPPALASASNNVGLWSGNATATFAYRRELLEVRRHLPFLSLVTLIGSGCGAAMLLWIGNAGFARLRTAMPMNLKLKLKGKPPTPEVQRDIDRIVEIWTEARTQFATSEGPYLFSEFSVADAMYAPIVWRFHVYNVALPPVANIGSSTMTVLSATSSGSLQ